MGRLTCAAALMFAANSFGGETVGIIERADPRFDKLIPPDAKIEKLVSGFSWAEGPVWIRKGAEEFLVFSDVPNNVVHRYNPGESKVTDFLRPSGYTGEKRRRGEPGSNGLAVDSKGRLLLCQHGDRRVARLEEDGKQTVLADRFEGKRFNSPNDLAVKSNGDVYFTDPPYGLEKGMNDPAKEIPFQGVYRIKTDGEVVLLTKEITRPNGIAFSHDEKTLYVCNSDPAIPVIFAFDVKEDGAIADKRVFFDTAKWLKKGLKGLPDGLKVDAEGNLFATGPGGVFVITPKGEYLGRIDPQVATANCGFGENGSVLYLTADKSLCKIKTTTRGMDLDHFGKTFKVD
jgi:gluconolactonase